MVSVSFKGGPRAVDDVFPSVQTGLASDSLQIVFLDVLSNDRGGNAKALYSLDDGVLFGRKTPVELSIPDLGPRPVR